MDNVLHLCQKDATWITDGTLCSDKIQQLSSISTIIENRSGTYCFGFFTDAKASAFVSVGDTIKNNQVKLLDFRSLKVTTAVISCKFRFKDITDFYLSPCGYDISIDFNQPGKKYTILFNSKNCVLIQNLYP